MPVTASCACGASYNLQPEFAGKLLKCPRCGAAVRAIDAASPPPLDYAGSRGSANPQADAVFDRDRFLLRQKVFSLNQRYTVSDDQQRPIIWVMRPSHVLRSLLAALAAIVTFFVVGGLFALPVIGMMDTRQGPDTLGWALIITGAVLALAACIVVAILISPKRHVLFFRDEAHQQKLIDVLQDSKWQVIIATYTLRDAEGQILARFRKNYLYNLIRKRWEVLTPDGSGIICRAVEDSIILSLLRRFLGTLYGLLRTNFIICRGHTDQVIGVFNRKFTIVDRYVLDMGPDPSRTLDRRIALALGVMLDTGERR